MYFGCKWYRDSRQIQWAVALALTSSLTFAAGAGFVSGFVSSVVCVFSVFCCCVFFVPPSCVSRFSLACVLVSEVPLVKFCIVSLLVVALRTRHTHNNYNAPSYRGPHGRRDIGSDRQMANPCSSGTGCRHSGRLRLRNATSGVFPWQGLLRKGSRWMSKC